MSLLTGQKLIRLKEFGKALRIFLDLKKKTKDPKIFFYLGMIYFELNNFNKSIHYYNKYLKEEPNSTSALHNLAIVKQSIGEIDAAKKIYLKLITLNKDKIRPYYGLFTLNQDYLTEENFNSILEIKEKQKLSLYEQGVVNFILSKKEKKGKRYKKEIEYLKNYHTSIFNFNYTYNISAQFYYNEIISKYYNKIKILNNGTDRLKNEELVPIFIIGLPRSGSTLIESILTSSTEKIRSFGECHTINMSVLEQIGPKIYEKDFNMKNFNFQIRKTDFQESVKKRYLQFNLNNDLHNKQFVDKSLENFFNIEIILNIFPKAKFLHTFRNPLDSIISIYQSMLPELSWTHSLENILHYLDNYYKVIAYFKSKYPEKIMDINLEKFTEENEKITKNIYKFCNLSWNKKSLDFYKRADLYSKTLSFSQIRSKISKYDNNKYTPYMYLLDDYKKKFKWINFN